MKHKKEIIIIAALIVLSAIGILILRTVGSFGASSTVLVITSEDQIVAELPLKNDAEKVIRTDKGENTVVIRDGQAYVIKADCPNQICVHSPKISQVGETIACLPHRLLLEIKAK